MAYFPAFLDFTNKRILIVGGGYVANEKLDHLLDFTSNITLVAKDYSKENMELITKNNLKFYEKAYETSDIEGFDIVIAAIDDFDIQEKIYFDTRDKNILCNCVDLKKYCDFIFPSYVKKGELTIAISTSGTSPALAKNLRIFLEKIIPDSIVDFIETMKEYRKTMPKGKERMQFLDKKARDYMEDLTKKENS